MLGSAGKWAALRGGRIILLILQVLLFAVLTVGALVTVQDVAGAQAAEDWDGVTEDKFDSAATDEANNKISEAQEKRDAAMEAQENLDCSLCLESRELDEETEAASDETREGVAGLVDARAQAIEEAPADTEEAIDEKQDALDTLQRYAEDWSPESSNEGTADPAVVDDVREEVEEQASEIEGGSGSSDEGSGGDSEGTTEGTTGEDSAASSPPPSEGSGDSSGGDSGGSDGGGSGGSDGGSDEGSGGGPLAGISSALGGFGLGTLLAVLVIGIGIVYYVGGLLREGIKERAGRVGRPTQAQAPRKPSSKGSSGGGSKGKQSPPEKAREEPTERQDERLDERSEGKKEPPKGAQKGGSSSPSDSSALADRLGAGGRRRRSDADGEDKEGGD